MSAINLAWNNAAITQWGGLLTGTAMNTGFRVQQNTNSCTYDFFFTGADTVGLNGGFYGTTGSRVVTLMDTSGNVLQTSTTTLTSNVTTVQTVNDFTGLTPATTYWLRISVGGFGNQIVQSDALAQLSGVATTPSVSAVTNYNPSGTYGFSGSTGFATAGNLQTVVGMEGNGHITTQSGATTFSNGGPRNGAILRFKGKFSNLFMRYYGAAAFSFRLQEVVYNGSSGVPTPILVYDEVNTSGVFSPWYQVATGLDTSTDHFYELYCQAGSGGGFLLEAMMTSGGTGIDLTTTTAGLTRTNIMNFIGDSRCQQNLGNGLTQDTPWSYSIAQFQQTANKQVINAGQDAETLQDMATTNLTGRVNEITGGNGGTVPTIAILIDIGINDIKSGSPPTVMQMQTWMETFINAVRAKSGYSTVPIYIEAIKPYNGLTFANIHTYNVGYQGVVSAFNAGTVSGQSPSPDPNVFYLDSEAWNLAGIPWKTGGSFDATNFIDGLHLNQTGYNLEAGFLEAAFLTASFYTLTGPTSGVINVASTNFTVTPNASYTGTITPHSSGAGTFSPTSLSWSGTSNAQTFTYTPTSVSGSPHSISTTSSPSLTDPSPISYTVTYPTLVASVISLGAPTDTTIVISCTASSGGLAPYTYQAQTSPHGMNTWTNNGSSSSSLPTSVTGLTAATNYDIRVVTTDSQPVNANSNVITSFTASSGGSTVSGAYAYS